jgi:toxin FitB
MKWNGRINKGHYECHAATCLTFTAGHRADRLTAWFDRLLALYGSKVLALDGAVARVAGAITDRARASGRDPGLADVAIAATAAVRELLILTRNGKHFAPLGVAHLDPFADILPPIRFS